jgi:hypothetical protein
MQIAPWLASVFCQFQILRSLKPLIEIVKALPAPPASAILEFSKAAEELAPCLLAPTSAGVLPFVRELLCLEIKSLTCRRNNLQAIAKLTATAPSGVAVADIQSVIDSYQPIVGLLDLASGIFTFARIAAPHAPALAQGTDAASLTTDQKIVNDFAATLQGIVDALGGCT